MAEKRPTLGPTDTFQRLLYAAICLTGPRVLISLYYTDKVDVAWFILCGWWLLTFLYTIDWAVASYRKRRSGNPRAAGRGWTP